MSARRICSFLAIAAWTAACSDASGPDGLVRPADAPILLGTNLNQHSTIGLLQADFVHYDTILEVDANLGAMTWAPDYQHIAYVRGTSEIWTINRDGSGNQLVTPVSLGIVGLDRPAWSPDGTRIAFGALTMVQGCGLYLLRLADTTLTRVTTPTSCANDPAWSPDGRYLAYTAPLTGGPFAGTRGLFVIGVDGSGNRQLASDPYALGAPSWSPDGRRLVFISNAAGPNDVWVIDADGTDARRLTVATDYYDLAPAWSPDGSTIAFIRAPGFGGSAEALKVPVGGGTPESLFPLPWVSTLAW
jgi:Tol biopolymer transport system component